jgi:nucleotide-binding universal stress UspA family protein
MKTIIVPLDFSKESLTGLDLAFMLAKKTRANIQMAYVIAKNESINDDLLDKRNEMAKMKFESILQKYKGKGKLNFELSYIIKEGNIFKEISLLGEAYEDALIVLSTHGQSGFEELFIGGNAYKIISHSRNPVITIRTSKIPSNINKIVLPLDITFQTREKVPYTVKLAKEFNSEIHLLTVSSTNAKNIEKKLRQYAEQVAKYIAFQKVPCTIKYLQGDNLTDITLEYAHSVKADLISIMTEQEKSLANLLLGSYAHQMINKTDIPVLSFPNYQIRIVADDIWTLGEFNAS